ncbi:hypothetical protein SAMN05444266_105369 [Chitinophaga jiangningensis]|uniref:Uncharacterized protein n=1 Tax=Chitinophaga jiangningensis TaxID=1419482 RepID=A0A1M7EB97_9BACT|nr:hypothetical protein SAMN05444266_105369 [Chitinophaga jiangningensis]
MIQQIILWVWGITIFIALIVRLIPAHIYKKRDWDKDRARLLSLYSMGGMAVLWFFFRHYQ